MTDEWGPGTDTGHGHVWPRPDGARMRCGGPGLCRACTADAATLGGRIGGGHTAPGLRWEAQAADGSPAGAPAVWAGFGGDECIARVVHARGGWLWDVFVGRDTGGTAESHDAAKAAAQAAWAAWCRRAGLAPAPAGDAPTAPGDDKVSPYKDGGQAPDAVARAAAALVDAAAPVIRDQVADATDARLSHMGAECIAAAVLAPALRELARRARCDDGRDTMGVGAWLDGLADALDAGPGRAP